MLTLDLLRTRIRGNCIEPRYVDTGSRRGTDSWQPLRSGFSATTATTGVESWKRC